MSRVLWHKPPVSPVRLVTRRSMMLTEMIVRCHLSSPGAKPTFHSLDTRPSQEGGAVFKTGEPLGWFDY